MDIGNKHTKSVLSCSKVNNYEQDDGAEL